MEIGWQGGKSGRRKPMKEAISEIQARDNGVWK